MEATGRHFAPLDQAGYDSSLLAMSPNNKTTGMDEHVERLEQELDGALVEQGRSSTSEISPPWGVVVFILGQMGTGKTTLGAWFFQKFQWYFHFLGWIVAPQASKDEKTFLWSIFANLLVLDDVQNPQTLKIANNALSLIVGARVIGMRRVQD